MLKGLLQCNMRLVIMAVVGSNVYWNLEKLHLFLFFHNHTPGLADGTRLDGRTIRVAMRN